jgi:tetratricopeptide (TPR) repeat protein
MIVDRRPPRYPRRGPSCLFVLSVLAGIFFGFLVILNADQVRDTIIPTPTPEPTRSAAEFALLAELSEQDGELAEATAYYQTAINLDPSRPELYIRLIDVLVRQGEAEEALEYAGRATLLASDRDDVWTAVAAAYIANGDRLVMMGDRAGANLQYAEAYIAALEATRINNQNATAYAYAAAGQVLQADFAKLEEAQQLADTAIFLDGSNPYARLYMGNVFTNYARYNEALEQYQLGIEANSNFADLYNALAYAYFATSRIPEAIVTFENTLRIDPNNATAYDGLAYMYIQLGVDAEAIDNALQAVELNPNMARAYGRLGHAYFRQSNYPEAIEALEIAIEMYREPTSLNALFFNRLGHAYLRTGTEYCTEQAIPIFEAVLQVAPPGSFEQTFAQEGLDECRRAVIQN